MKYIDSHAHYLSYRYNNDREELLNNLFNNDLKYIIECGTNIKSNDNVIKLINEFEKIYGVIGFFPSDVKELENPETLFQFMEQLKHEKILGIGEIGLDYHYKSYDKATQIKYFIKQLELAKSLNLPVCIHSRDAEEDTLNILRDFGKNQGVIHCYSYGVETMNKLQELGYYFGVGGTSTYKNNEVVRKAIIDMPLNKIVLETDCPYLTPHPFRRFRNDSLNLKYVIKEISDLKNISKEEVIRSTNNNVFMLYPKLKNK